MSTSLLYHRFGIVGYHYVSQDFEPGHYHLSHRATPRTFALLRIAAPTLSGPRAASNALSRTCPSAASPRSSASRCRVSSASTAARSARSRFAFADPKKRYTRAFERYALELSRHMTIQDVAEHLVIGWDTIKEIQAKYLQRRFGKPKLHKLKQIAIDEITIGKGHRYLTVVLNLALRSGGLRRRRQRRGCPGTLLAASASARTPRSRPWPPTCRSLHPGHSRQPASEPFMSSITSM